MPQVKVQQMPDDVQYQVIARGANVSMAEDAAVLRDYFNLQACLKELCEDWSRRDARFQSLHAYFPGKLFFEILCMHRLHTTPDEIRSCLLLQLDSATLYKCLQRQSINASPAKNKALHDCMSAVRVDRQALHTGL